MGLEFARELFEPPLTAELLALAQDHQREVGSFREIELDPALDKYAAIERAGILRLFTARETALQGRVVGYATFMVIPHLHRQTSIEATQDTFFLSSIGRRGTNGYRFLKWCDQALAEDGVRVIHHHVTVHNDFSPLLKRMGYTLIGKGYARRIS